MKNVFKKVISVVLGVLMFLFPAQRAFAQIEVVEFSDESRLIRFKKEDLQNMVDWYAARVSEHEQNVARRDECRVEFSMLGAVGFGSFGLALTCAGAFATDGSAGMLAGGVILDMLCILCGILMCYCCCGYGTAKLSADGFGQVRAIRDWLIRNKVMAGADESSHLLQSAPNCFLLLERRKDKASTDPRPFFTSDRNTTFSQNLVNNRFAGLIRDVGGKLRAHGVRTTKRYYLIKAGVGFATVSDPSIMPEIDSVEVVVD